MEYAALCDLLIRIDSNQFVNPNELKPYVTHKNFKNYKALLKLLRKEGIPQIWVFYYKMGINSEHEAAFFLEDGEKLRDVVSELKALDLETHIRYGMPDKELITSYTTLLIKKHSLHNKNQC